MNVRPIQPGDASNYRSILSRTTAQDRYCRFFHVVDHFSYAEVERFVRLDSDMLGYIALAPDGTALGTVHAFLTGARTAEFAIVVARDVRRRGVGKALFGRLLVELRARGYRRLLGYALAENYALTNLAKAAGMHSAGVDATVRTWSLEDVAVANALTTSDAER